MNERIEVGANDLTKRTSLVFACVAVVVPFVTSNQIITGTIVNFLLFAVPRKYVWPVVVLPSLAVMARGVIFGPFTPFLFYFIPFIWLSNLVLAANKNKGFVVAAILKTAVLYLAARMYFEFKIVPEVFVTSMGVLQLVTAIFGGILWKMSARSLKNFWSF